jgi:hypothetical protein
VSDLPEERAKEILAAGGKLSTYEGVIGQLAVGTQPPAALVQSWHFARRDLRSSSP